MKTIYGSKGCAKCQQLKMTLDSNNETFKYVDISTLSKQEIADILAISGQMNLPIVIEE